MLRQYGYSESVSVKFNIIKKLFCNFNYRLNSQGYKDKEGDCLCHLFYVPMERKNTDKIRKKTERFTGNSNIGAQKDVDFRWIKRTMKLTLATTVI